jgi:hypothetical protein
MTGEPTKAPEPVNPHHTGYRFVKAEDAGEARQGLGPLLAATGLIIWCVSYFGFHNNMPLAVSGALYTIIPSVIGYLATHVTFKKVTL